MNTQSDTALLITTLVRIVLASSMGAILQKYGITEAGLIAVGLLIVQAVEQYIAHRKARDSEPPK